MEIRVVLADDLSVDKGTMHLQSDIDSRAAVAICLALAAISLPSANGQRVAIPDESPAAAKVRHDRVAERRARTQIICHRGAVEFAHENTLEAYRAAFELGADGNEIDIRATKDGVLICFHDDMLDHLLEAYGDVADYTWDELRQLRFRNPGPLGEQCRIPTLIEVLELHRQHAGLLHLDIKRPELAKDVTGLVDRMDMWDHVVQAPAEIDDPRVKRGRYKASLYSDRSEVDAEAITEALKKPGDSLIVEDPRGVVIALGRKSKRPSDKPVTPVSVPTPPSERPLSTGELLGLLRDANDWNLVASGEQAEAKSGGRIVRRAKAADALGRLGVKSDEAIALLTERVRHRSLHRHWRYHGLDGAAALRALIRIEAPRAVELARFCLWRDDPNIESVVNPKWDNPRSWTDWRTKMIVFPELVRLPGEETERLCRDYLSLSDDAAQQIGVLQFEPAARTLLTVSPNKTTAVQLMKHRRSDVRGRAILFCLAHAHEPWAEAALSTAAPHALAYRLPEPDEPPGGKE
jgi:hypothetical protein